MHVAPTRPCRSPLGHRGHQKAVICSNSRPTACRMWPFSSSRQGSDDQPWPDDTPTQEVLQPQQPERPPPPPPPQQQQQQPVAPPIQGRSYPAAQQAPPELLRTSPKWRWLDRELVDSAGQQGQQQLSQAAKQQQPRQQQQPQRQQWDDLTPQQRDALQGMIWDATVNPKWRWPSFGNTTTPTPMPPPPPFGVWQQQQPTRQPPSQQAQKQPRKGGWGTPPPPPPPPPPGYGSTQQQQFEQPQGGRWQQQQQQPAAGSSGSSSDGWRLPFFGGSGLSPVDEEYREQLEAMGVDLVGSRRRQKQQRQQWRQQQPGGGSSGGSGGGGDDGLDFESMDDSQIAAYMNQLRQSRLERVQNRQDDEVVGIAGLYLGVTFVILALAVLANLTL